MSGNLAKQRGFTLLETMIAGGMLVAGVIGLMGMQITAINGSRFGNRFAQAMMLADEQASRVMGQPWTTLETYTTANASGQPDGFTYIDPLVADPTGFSPAFAPEGINVDGKVLATWNDAAATYQRIVQVRGDDINPNIPGIDVMRIKVTVRFRDSQATGRWRQADIVVLRPKQI